MKKVDLNIQNNKNHYDEIYSRISFKEHQILYKNFDQEFKRRKNTHLMWNVLFNNLGDVSNKKILEIGAGDCLVSLALSLLGANVYVNDISHHTSIIANNLNDMYLKSGGIFSVSENLLDLNNSQKFDIIIGMAIIHHLDEELEFDIIKTLLGTLKENGKIVFIEPQDNSKFFRFIKNLFPSGGRPSILNYSSFRYYKLNIDPHPLRDNSSEHYIGQAKHHGCSITIVHLGLFYTFSNFFKRRKSFLLKLDNKYNSNYLYKFISKKFGRTQLIILQKLK
jgi:2-polyprenyl-3-methyl-5-hydroxy-6-metoxy-1,4-benzoquinol methylase